MTVVGSQSSVSSHFVEQVDTVEVHAEGEPSRVVIDGDRYIKGSTMAQRFDYCVNELNDFRRFLLQEPRGGPSFCGTMLTSPERPESHFGIIVLEQGGYTPMSGSNTMCAVAGALHAGIIERGTRSVRIDTAVGTVSASLSYDQETGQLIEVSVDNVPAYVVGLDIPLEVPGHGLVPVDVVFGGQFFVQLDVAAVGLELDPSRGKELAAMGVKIKAAANEQLTVEHPESSSINSVNLVMLHSGNPGSSLIGSNTVVLSNGELSTKEPSTWVGTLDRSPCGTGTSGRMAALHARGLLELNQDFTHRSIIGSRFVGKLLAEDTSEDGQIRVYPRVSGRAWVTGEATWLLQKTDMFPRGFTVSDIWAPDSELNPLERSV